MITSFQNPTVKKLRQLRQKKVRLREKAGFVEGIRAVMTAVETRPDLIESVIVAPDLLTSRPALDMVETLAGRGVSVVSLSADVFKKISERENPTGLAAVVRSPLILLTDIQPAVGGIYVGLEEISDPGNLGTILRAIDAAGADGCILVGPTTDLTHPTTLKASMGSAFTVPVAAVDDPQDLLSWAKTNEVQLLATSARAESSYWTAPYEFPVLLLMGNEQRGLSVPLREAADQLVSIPMMGQPTSLNLAVATSLFLYELRRRLVVN